MKHILPHITFLYLFLFCPNLYSQTLSAEQIYEKVKDAVVVILAYDYADELAAQGSGVVLNDKGYVVTNYHVLAGNERLEIKHGNEKIPYVDIIGIDVEKDILILKIEEKKFPSVKMGDIKKLKVGQRVYAIGSPMGFENTISEGIISGLRSYDDLGKNYIQITASISPGSSGGAVVNDKGELIGISSSTIEEGQNLNFAIPIDDVLNVGISSYSENNSYRDFELLNKGINAFEKGNFNDAVILFSKFIKLHPNYDQAYYNRGLSKYYLGNFNGALLDYDKAIDINPNDVDTYNNRGALKNQIGDYRGAIMDYTKAIELNPSDAVAYSNRSIVRNKLGDYLGALQDNNQAIEIDPNDSIAFYNRGVAKYHLGDYTGAIEDFSKAIKLNPYFTEAYSNCGLAKDNLGDYKGAIQDYNKAIEINPYFALAYYNRGITKINLGDVIGACSDWSKAGELGHYKAYDLIKDYCN